MPDISEHVQLLAESLVFSSGTEARNYLPVSVFVFVFIYRNSGEETWDFQLLFSLFNLVVALFSFTEIQVRKLEELVQEVMRLVQNVCGIAVSFAKRKPFCKPKFTT